MEETIATTETQPFLGADWFDPLETAVRGRIRGFIEEMLEAELHAALQRGRYDRQGTTHGHRHSHRARQLVGTFGPVALSVPRARLAGADGRTSEWRNQTIPAYRRLTKRAEARIKTQCLLPCAETACMLFWALLASGQINLRRVDGWDTFHVQPAEQNLDLAA